MDETAKNLLKTVVGVSDEDLAKVPRNIEKIFSNQNNSNLFRIDLEAYVS